MEQRAMSQLRNKGMKILINNQGLTPFAIKKGLMEEPELRNDFILRMKDIDLEKSIMVENFGERYGLK